MNVINDILDFSKVEAGQIELENIEFDLAGVLEEAVEIAGVRARAKGLGVSARIQPDVPTRLIGDPGRLRQILLNLLGNATKFTERGELTVLVETDAAPHVLHFSVSDTGVGIPADRLSRRSLTVSRKPMFPPRANTAAPDWVCRSQNVLLS